MLSYADLPPRPRLADCSPRFVALFLLMPLLAVVPVSFTPSRMLSMPSGELSLRHYRALIEDPRWLDSILLSIRIGIVSSAFSHGAGALPSASASGCSGRASPRCSSASCCCRWWCRRSSRRSRSTSC